MSDTHNSSITEGEVQTAMADMGMFAATYGSGSAPRVSALSVGVLWRISNCSVGGNRCGTCRTLTIPAWSEEKFTQQGLI